MIIEILFGEICNLYGDPQNAEYLSQSLKNPTIIRTSLDSKPYFADNRPNMILIGSMSDSMHHFVVEKLQPYKDRILELMNLVESIDGSSSWIDQDVKGSFVATCVSYINLYRDLAVSMENYVNYLIRKSDSASAIESAYSRG